MTATFSRTHIKRMLSCLAPVCTTAAYAVDLHVPGEYATIQAAIDASNHGDTVIVAPGVYNEALRLFGRRITLRSSDGPEATTLDGAGLSASILRAEAGETFETVIEGFTFENGRGSLRANCINGQGWVGGAIYVRSGQLTIRDCVFRENGISLGFEMTAGGAIYCQSGGLDIRDSTFGDNGGFGDTGDGIHSGGALYVCVTDLTIDGSLFEGNGPAGHGGGVYAVESDLTVTNTDFLNNNGSHGGGLRAHGVSGSTNTIRDCRFEGNISSHGGGLNASTSGQTTISACTFTRNRASFGGAMNVDVSGSGTLSLEDIDAIDNDAGFGGGIFGSADSNARLTISGAIVADNIASGACCATGIYSSECFVDGSGNPRFWGGGADLRTLYGGEIAVYNSLFENNTANRGGGVHMAACGGGYLEFVNNTAVGNAPTGLHLRNGGAASEGGAAGVLVASNSIIADNVDAVEITLRDTTVEPVVAFSNVTGGHPGTGNIDAPPLFADAAVGDYRLAGGSPGIDAADNDALPNDVLTDLDGAPRYADDPGTLDTGSGAAPLIDMGAFEFQGVSCPADLDGDGTVGIEDLATLLSNYGIPGGPSEGDLDGDGVVGFSDLATMLSAFGQACG